MEPTAGPITPLKYCGTRCGKEVVYGKKKKRLHLTVEFSDRIIGLEKGRKIKDLTLNPRLAKNSSSSFQPNLPKQKKPHGVPTPCGVLFPSQILNYSLSPNQSIIAWLTPVNENPPSWNRFCIVTIRVKSENRVTA